jgi:phosphate transport system substrate-binding protein
MSRGVCTNLPSACSQAASRALLPCPDAEARCPTCGAALLPLDERSVGGQGRAGVGRWALSSLLVVGAVGVGWQWWSGPAAVPVTVAADVPTGSLAASSVPLVVAQAASALESDPPASGSPQVLVWHGMDTLGPALGAELMEAFLVQEGHVEVNRSAPDAQGAVLVSARQPGGQRQDMRLMFDGGRAAEGGASLRRVSHAAEADAGLADPAHQRLIGMDALAVVVHPGSLMDRISLAQLRDLMSGRLSEGARLGAMPGPVRVNVRDEASDAWRLVQQQVLGTHGARTDLQHHATDAALVQAVVADEHALGLVPLSAAGSAKVLALVDTLGSIWIPTPESVATERYPLTHRLVAQVPPTASPMALRYAQFLASTTAQNRLRSHGLASASPMLVEQDAMGPASAGAGVKLPKDYVALTRGARQVAGRIGFAAESAELDAVSRREIDRLAHHLKTPAGRPSASVMVLGVASDPGGFCFNRVLSDQRAASVAQALTEQGVKVRVVRGVGRFTPAPVVSTDDAARDRRVEVWVSDEPVRQPAAFKCVSGNGKVAMVGAPTVGQ